jgi:hypothetical protein
MKSHDSLQCIVCIRFFYTDKQGNLHEGNLVNKKHYGKINRNVRHPICRATRKHKDNEHNYKKFHIKQL